MQFNRRTNVKQKIGNALQKIIYLASKWENHVKVNKTQQISISFHVELCHRYLTKNWSNLSNFEKLIQFEDPVCSK